VINRKLHIQVKDNRMLYSIPFISTIFLLVIVLELVKDNKIKGELLGIALSFLGIILPIIFLFFQWLGETSEKIDNLEKEIIRNTAKIEYFGKFTEVNNSLNSIYERQARIIHKLGERNNENI